MSTSESKKQFFTGQRRGGVCHERRYPGRDMYENNNVKLNPVGPNDKILLRSMCIGRESALMLMKINCSNTKKCNVLTAGSLGNAILNFQ